MACFCLLIGETFPSVGVAWVEEVGCLGTDWVRGDSLSPPTTGVSASLEPEEVEATDEGCTYMSPSSSERAYRCTHTHTHAHTHAHTRTHTHTHIITTLYYSSINTALNTYIKHTLNHTHSFTGHYLFTNKLASTNIHMPHPPALPPNYLLAVVAVASSVLIWTVLLPGVVVLYQFRERLGLHLRLQLPELLTMDPPGPAEQLALLHRPLLTTC